MLQDLLGRTEECPIVVGAMVDHECSRGGEKAEVRAVVG